MSYIPGGEIPRSLPESADYKQLRRKRVGKVKKFGTKYMYNLTHTRIRDSASRLSRPRTRTFFEIGISTIKSYSVVAIPARGYIVAVIPARRCNALLYPLEGIADIPAIGYSGGVDIAYCVIF